MTTSICNLEQLRAMTGDDISIMKEFIKMYLKDTPNLVSKIREAKTRKSYIGEDSVAWCCHKMAPQLSYMGMVSCHEMIKSIEAKLKELNGISYPELESEIDAVNDICLKSYRELNDFLNSNE
ncbi:MAG: hypothetical protein RJA07_2600 [Bacteroidota bacterium]|jgi:HPt (histidine-containing phosphotransfer) domain-containing protein